MSDQTLFAFARMTPAEYRDDCQQGRLTFEAPERRAGEIIREMPKAEGAKGNPGGQGARIVRSDDSTPQTLSDLGISRDESSRSIRLVDCPSCGGSTFDNGDRPLLCHCGAKVED